MSNLTDDDDLTMTKLVQFRCHRELVEAMERARKRDFSSLSDVVRACIARTMRADGLLEET